MINTQEIRLQDLETHRSLKDDVLHSLLKKNINPRHCYNEEEQTNFEAFSKQLNQTTIRDQLEEILKKYKEPPHSVASLKELNTIFWEENRRRQKKRGDNTKSSTDHQITIAKDGTGSV